MSRESGIHYYHTKQGALEYGHKHPAGFHKPQFHVLRELLPLDFRHDGANLLEIGSGHAPDYPLFRENGFRYTGVDASQAMIDVARSAYGKEINIYHQDIRRLEVPARSFHAVWASAVLHHLQRIDLGSALIKIKNSLVPGGIAYLSVRGRDNLTRISERTQISYTHYTENFFGQALQDNGFKIRHMGNETFINPVPGDGSSEQIEYTFAYVSSGDSEISKSSKSKAIFSLKDQTAAAHFSAQ